MLPVTILDKITRTNFKYFLLQVFSTLHPCQNFIDNWHINLMISALKEVEQGSITRLIVNIPPRSLKSITISVAWPAWLLGHIPSHKVIVASYSQAISLKHAQDTKVIMESSWYRRIFPCTIIAKGKNTQRKYITTQQGFRLAASVGATLTGEGADVIVVDDPHTPQQALSNKLRQKAIDWYEQTLITRLNDRINGRIVIVMQRLHRDDLSGHLLQKKIYQHLAIPLHNEDSNIISCGHIMYLRPANILYPDMNTEQLRQLQQELGAYNFAAQYQQKPQLLEHGLIRSNWIKRYTIIPELDRVYQSWDCAVKVGTNNDYSVCTTWAVIQEQYYLLEVLRTKLEYSELKQEVLRLYNQYKPSAVLIEDKASGQQLLSDLQHTATPALGIRPKLDKITRVLAASSLFEAGKIWWPRYSDWLADYESEIFTFPYTAHDDQMDSTTQFLNWIRQHQEEKSAQIRWL